MLTNWSKSRVRLTAYAQGRSRMLEMLDWDPDRKTKMNYHNYGNSKHMYLRSRQKDWVSGLHPSGLSTVDDVFAFTEQ